MLRLIIRWKPFIYPLIHSFNVLDSLPGSLAAWQPANHPAYDRHSNGINTDPFLLVITIVDRFLFVIVVIVLVFIAFVTDAILRCYSYS